MSISVRGVIPTCLCSHEPHPLLLPNLRALEPHLSMKRDARYHTENGFRQIRKICDYTVVSKVTKILLVKDHARKGKESFHVKTKDNTCATFAVGQFN